MEQDRLAHLRWGLAAAGPLLVVGTLVEALAAGPAAAAGFAAGCCLVAASFTATSLVVAMADRVAPALILPFGMTVYVTKFLAIVLIMAAVGASDWAGRLPLGIGFAATAVIWVAAQAAWVLRRGPHAGLGTTGRRAPRPRAWRVPRRPVRGGE